ncbi:MAG: HDOD domain-containing protein [Planctomycetes bacterium]|nr:HDOD domain-containing protein [Planctomycetota bacterium]
MNEQMTFTDPRLVELCVRQTQLAKSLDLGVSDRTMTVHRAVVLLGFTVIRNLVLSIHIFDTLTQRESSASAHREGIREHSLAVACVADMLAGHMGPPMVAGEAFVCGLLHDIGKIALDACLPKSYLRVIERVDREHACICDVEQELFGLDHTVAGRRLAARWKLSDPILECIWLHHQSADALVESVAHPQLVRTVHLADSLVRLHGIGYSGYPILSDVDELLTELGLGEEVPVEVMARLPERIKPFIDILNPQDSSTDPCSWQSLTNVNRQLGQINTKLRERNRDLELRSEIFETLHRFTHRCSREDGVGDVCAAAAEAIRAMVNAQCAVAFAGDPSQPFVHVGVSNHSDPQPLVDVIDLGSPLEVKGLLEGATVGQLAPASEHCESIWQQCGPRTGESRLWMLPIACEPGWIGAILFNDCDDSVRRFLSARVECEALTSSVRLALSSANTRVASERMNQELLDSNRRVRAAQQSRVRTHSIAMVAEMASGAAHEMNNPLAVISGRAQLMLAQYEDPELARSLRIIVEQTQRASGIVNDLMGFAKPAPPQSLVQTLYDMLDMLCQHWRTTFKLTEHQLMLSVNDPRVTVYADLDQLREILTALVTNAVEATSGETTRLQVNSPSSLSDETVRIVIRDNGVGMTRDVLEHALDPLFSSRPAGRGRGLGLSRAYRLAEVNGGRLWLESTPGQGTTVTLELPVRAPQD